MSPNKKAYLRQIGYTDAQIKQLEQVEVKSKDSPLAELVYKMATDGKPAGDGGAIGQMVREKLTKDAPVGATPSPLVNGMIAHQRGA